MICLGLGYQRGWYMDILVSQKISQLGGSAYTSQFPKAANDVLLVTGITCSNSATTLSECTFSYFTKTSTCDVKRLLAIKCHSHG